MGVLRLFLAMSVVVWHMPNRSLNLLDASVAVLFFFILSGFYMALVINERYGVSGSRGWKGDFYASRLFRLFPAYLLVLLIMVIWFKWTATPDVFLNHPNLPVGAHLALVTLNLFIVGQDFFQVVVNAVATSDASKLVSVIVSSAPRGFFTNEWMLIGQAWSLGSELLFYALAPLIVRSVPRILLCATLSLAVRWGLILGLGFHSDVWGYNFFPATLCLFLLGSLSYHLYAKLRHAQRTALIGAFATIAMAIFAGASIWRVGSVLLVDPASGFDTPRLWAAYLVFAASLPFVFACWRNSNFDRLIGEISYPLYIVHGLIIGIVFDRVPGSHVALEFFACGFSVAAAALIFFCIDRPVDAWRHRHFESAHAGFPKRTFGWAMAVAVATALIGYTLALDTFAQAEGPPAKLLAVEGRYNIVRYDGRYFGVLQGVPIIWGRPGFDADEGLIIGSTYTAVAQQVRTRAMNRSQGRTY